MAGGTAGIVPGARVQRAYLDTPLFGVVVEHEGALRVQRDDGRLEETVGWYVITEVADFCTPAAAYDCDDLVHVVSGNPKLRTVAFHVPVSHGEVCAAEAGCPMAGACHGPLVWCDTCGNVGADNCDDEDCDAHRYRLQPNGDAPGWVVYDRHEHTALGDGELPPRTDKDDGDGPTLKEEAPDAP